MKTASLKEIKTDLKEKTREELLELCLTVTKFKKENKEYLTYLLFNADAEEQYIADIKEELENSFLDINTSSYFFIRKSVRKNLKRIKTYIRYSKNKETEADLLLFFCEILSEFKPSISRNQTLVNTFYNQLKMAKNALNKLHEDLQFDYKERVENLEQFKF